MTALAEAGPGAVVLTLDTVSYAIGLDTMVIILEPGDRPDGTAVQSADEIALRGEPIPIEAGLAIDRRSATGLRFVGFVRLAEGCLPLGPLEFLCSWQSFERPELMAYCGMKIVNRLPFDLLDLVRPVVRSQHLPDLGWVTLLPGDPVAALRAFVDTWYADVPSATGEPASSPVPLPAPLNEFYRVAAGRNSILSGVNEVLAADKVRTADHDPFDGWQPVPDGLIVVGTNLATEWGIAIDPAQPDPQVLYLGVADEPVVEREPLSAYLMQHVLVNVTRTLPFHASAEVTAEQARRLVEPLRRVPLRPMRWPRDETSLYVGSGLVVAVCAGPQAQPRSAWSAREAKDDGDLCEIMVGAIDRSVLLPMREPGFEWASFGG
ncbi:hypothetical protein HDA40_000768 [Hamadaea flava]|uniref:Uncharacterized protein n=1 Tax=Hamadaea flava TaxID=1742688 RepID=A0ABV8LTG9_9ACTN|nr:hypothetical protein [Hamadaea flava]MCP2322261.1 hypothetical protein [Hamadaea flava]